MACIGTELILMTCNVRIMDMVRSAGAGVNRKPQNRVSCNPSRHVCGLQSNRTGPTALSSFVTHVTSGIIPGWNTCNELH
jgi:hypothetical protein